MAKVGSFANRIPDFYRGKKVVVTGDTGFKGSWLALWLLELGADVTGIALEPETKNAHYNLINLTKLYPSHRCDIRNLPELEKVVKGVQPEIVFHLAAQPIVRTSYKDPLTTYSTNVMGTLNLMECIREVACVRSFICVTSDKCYKNKEWVWGYRETDELGGHDPYSSSKACAELLFESYARSYFQDDPQLGAATVRAGNVIGGGDDAVDRIVPDIARALTKNEQVILRSPHATRPWQHVLEPLSGYLALAMKLFVNPKDYGGAWNFGPGHSSVCTVEDLVKKFISVWGQGSYKIESVASQQHEARLLQLAIDKAKVDLGWSPLWNFEQTVEETALWYLASAKKENLAPFSLGQIHKYMESWT